MAGVIIRIGVAAGILFLSGCDQPSGTSAKDAPATTSAAAASADSAARYCQVEWQGSSNDSETSSHYEARIRKKCQTGDIIAGNWAESVARFCDLSKPVVTMSGGAGAYVCYLAPKREVY